MIRISFNRILQRVLLLVDIMGQVKQPILLDIHKSRIHKSCIHKSCIHIRMVNHIKVYSCCFRMVEGVKMVVVGVQSCFFRMDFKDYMGKVLCYQNYQSKLVMDQIF